MKILVVEDDRKVAGFIEQGLREEGYMVDVAPDGDEATMLAHVYDYDLLVLDVMLPKKTGLQVAAELRRAGAGRTELLHYGPVELDRLKHKVRVGGKNLDLTPKEFHLLQNFLPHTEEVVRRTELLEKVWDMHFDPESNVVDVHVGNLRRK